MAARLPKALVLLSYNKFYFDEIYDAVLVRPIKATARAMRRVVEPVVLFLLALPCSLLAGVLSWHLVEKWFLRRGRGKGVEGRIATPLLR